MTKLSYFHYKKFLFLFHFCSYSVDSLGSISGKLLRGLISNDSVSVVPRIRFDGYFHVFDPSLDFNEGAWRDVCYQMKLSGKTVKN